ncbi:MAG: SDR family NAD(P)-dependent oxidoreductase, partial [Actinobacteria bacterium]|nr:SDR family NAD(P)-dependent oxidoreductase [Actinomycetota bacterium]
MPPRSEPAGPLDFSGRVVVVTGGCRGIGAGIARRFLRAGAGVVICCRHAPDDVPAAGGRTAAFVEADVRDPDQID